MAMSDYEPTCGFNMPPGCFDVSDDTEPWLGRKCCDCLSYYPVPEDVDDTFVGFCDECKCYIDGNADACEGIAVEF